MRSQGFTLLEMLLALAIGAVLVAALGGVVSTALQANAEAEGRREVSREARFAMERMTRAVRKASVLLLPLVDNPTTVQNESVREVLALDLDPTQDLDADGIPDADNDGDGRIDEDPGADLNQDGYAGIRGIDDDGDGQVDETNKEDDDEDEDGAGGGKDEDIVDGSDNDLDGSVDEDPNADLNDDGAAGVAGLDDDGDGSVDETNKEDDDEDEDAAAGDKDEDWIDSVVFYRQGGTLIERTPVPWDESGDSVVDGEDVVESTLAEGVSLLQVERVPLVAGGRQLVELTLELTGPEGQVASLRTRVRVGAER